MSTTYIRLCAPMEYYLYSFPYPTVITYNFSKQKKAFRVSWLWIVHIERLTVNSYLKKK